MFLFTKNHREKTEAVSLLLERPGENSGVNLPEIDGGLDLAAADAKALVCQRCRWVITTQDQATEIHGEHQHTFFNPAGIVHQLRCFNQAPGCLVHSEPSMEFTWFKDHSWQFCLCNGCLIHLGWFFQSASGSSSSFYALIKNNLLLS